MKQKYVYEPVEAKTQADTVFTAKRLSSGLETGIFLTKCTVYSSQGNFDMEFEDATRRKTGDIFNAFYCNETGKMSLTDPNVKEEKSGQFSIVSVILIIIGAWIIACAVLGIRDYESFAFKVTVCAGFQTAFFFGAICFFYEGICAKRDVKKGTKVDAVITGYMGERYINRRIENKDNGRTVPVREFNKNDEIRDVINKQHTTGHIDIDLYRPIIMYEWKGEIKKIHLPVRYSGGRFILNKYPIGSQRQIFLSTDGRIIEKSNQLMHLVAGTVFLIFTGLMFLIY